MLSFLFCWVETYNHCYIHLWLMWETHTEFVLSYFWDNLEQKCHASRQCMKWEYTKMLIIIISFSFYLYNSEFELLHLIACLLYYKWLKYAFQNLIYCRFRYLNNIQKILRIRLLGFFILNYVKHLRNTCDGVVFNKTSGLQPANTIKMQSLTGSFKGFILFYRNSWFKKQLRFT